MKLNEKILYYRKAARLSQEELAAQIGVSRQAVSKWELAGATPEVDKLLALARIFGVTTDELLREGEPAESQNQPEAHQENSPPPVEPDAPAADGFGQAAGCVGRLVRKYGWLAGAYVSLYGLGFLIVGMIARWGFKSIFGTAGQLMGESVIYNGPPELRDEVLGQLGFDAAVSPFGGMRGFALGFSNVIIVIGAAMMIAGVVLAAILYRMGNRKN